MVALLSSLAVGRKESLVEAENFFDVILSQIADGLPSERALTGFRDRLRLPWSSIR